MILRRLLPLVLASLPATAQEAANTSAIQLRTQITMEGENYRVAIEGQTRLPDGAVVLLELSPLESGGKPAGILCASRAEVKQGGFSMVTPWTVRRENITSPTYRVEARLANEQTDKVRKSLRRGSSAWQTAIDIPLGDWRSRSAQIVPIAKALSERVGAFTRHRDGLLAMAREQSAGKLSSGAWTGWRGRTDLLRDRNACEVAVVAPISSGTFPRSCGKAQTILGQFDGIFFAIDGELKGGVGAGNPERKAMLKLADRDIPPDYLRDFYAMLAPEGASLYARALEEVAGTLKPAAKGAPVASGVLATAEKDVSQIFRQVELFFAGEWAADAVEPHRALLDLLADTQKLVTDLKGAPSAGADALTQCAASFASISARLVTLQAEMKKRLDQ
jgi:hypothetical protein